MLTKRPKEVLNFIKTYVTKKGYAPSLEEIRKHFRFASVSTAHFHVSRLQEGGYLKKIENQARAISVPRRESFIKIPLLGTIAAGEPIEAIPKREFIAVSKTKLPRSGDIYALRVVGNSMVDENINDGDVVLVKHQEVAENGQKVVALIDNYEATLKKFYREKDHIRLQPANKTLEPIIIRKDRDIKIQGIVVDVITETPRAEPQTLFGDYEPLKKRWTGYSIYNEDAKRRTKQNTLPSLYPKLPNKEFDIIYADPPWDYNGKMQFDKTSKSVEQIDLTKKIFISSATFKYPTLKTSELMKIPVQEIAKNDCLLFMWTTNPHLSQAIGLGEAWGFEYKTVAFIWDKINHNPGQYTLSNCELCLVFKRGRIPRPRGARNVQQLIRSPRKAHSEKPMEVIQAIEKMFPTQERVELFARRKAKGWSAWGLDVLNLN